MKSKKKINRHGPKKPGYPRREMSHRPNVFTIKSWSAIQEFLKHKPVSIKEIHARDEWQVRVKTWVDQHPDINVTIIGQSDIEMEDVHPVTALVKLDLGDEISLIDRLRPDAEMILVLDHITDPRNLGAIARNAAFFGIKEIVAPKDRQVLLTDASVQTSQGAFSKVNLTVVTNISRFIEQMKAKDFWVLGTKMDGEPIHEVGSMYEKVILVMGSEDNGLSKIVEKKCDRLLSIPGVGGFDSLNVSVAAGIAIYALLPKT